MPTAKPETSLYNNPLIERYASREMAHIFSPDVKFITWRKLWIALAETQQELGLPITDEQIGEMKSALEDIDYAAVKKIEAQTRHDVMAHLLAFGEKCPEAKPIMHLGATSAFVGDNTDLIQIKQGARLLLQRFTPVLKSLKDFAAEHKSLATLGFTHFQPAQLTTVGKRTCLWAQELLLDFEELDRFYHHLPFRGAKGTTGTQASYLKLFEGNHEKVQKLDAGIAHKLGFTSVLPVTGQTYTRKIDAQVAGILSGLAQSLHKMANDIRLLQNMKEIEEPFGANQVGSSAMAYKRNPMRCERLTSLCRYLITLAQSPAMTAAEQWFERTLDDSANKRLSLPEAFMAADAILLLAANVCNGLVVYPRVIEKHIHEELPFMATENILMEAVKKGGDRQVLHEKIRTHAQAAGARVKQEGKSNDLLSRIEQDTEFNLNATEISAIVNVEGFVGRAPEQVDEFIRGHLSPALQRAVEFGPPPQYEIAV
ncbi:MAG: adenylosuccinate lyase [Chitinivibrionales bacterium]|nr:adenylosuccinate lyase [Chitinivibrionales bacterium]